MRRANISTISISFAIFALVVCCHSLFVSSETAIKTQAIYWFYSALISAIIPYLEEIAVYVKTIKVGSGGIEIAMNEVKEKIQKIDAKVEKMDNKLLQTLERVQQNEAILSQQARDIRQQNYDSWTVNILAKMSPQEKLATQESLTHTHLKNEGVGITQLKEMLNQLGYYHGNIDQAFNPELAQAVEKFQLENGLGIPDGIAGSVTLTKIAELLRR
ncbi:MAG: peptidoglycan-binding protein [Microcystis aeruginosa BS13-02]|jgi:murein L,D-transpeptidase YcbB/YkuD|uniref:peptidoglycan-binding domain-containing protein n=1 Tax=Microcystis sp. BLCC-F210 TaxID=3342751 RepID=UPI0035C895B3|nr:peptidoglycan-binding protein [Microcystis aeruginosa BS13-02]